MSYHGSRPPGWRHAEAHRWVTTHPVSTHFLALIGCLGWYASDVPRILVVDDEPDGIDLVALRPAGFEVETVPGGRVAREQLGYATFLRDAGGWPSSRPAVRSTESAHPTTR
jgi:hypothetical protein